MNTKGVDPDTLSPLVLAYIGDAVYELYTRLHLVKRMEGSKVHHLHQETVGYVRAATQARLAHRLEGLLTPLEAEVLRRGRNAKSGYQPKGAGVTEYRYSTGLESLVGYLYLTGQTERLDMIFDLLHKLVETGVPGGED